MIDPLAENFGIGQITNPNGAARHLVLIGRPDAAPRRADLVRPARLLDGTVQIGMQGQDQAGIVGNFQRVRPDFDTHLDDFLDLAKQGPGVDDDAIPDDADLARADDT